MNIPYDWHIHSQHSPCGKPEGSPALIVQQARKAGLREFGITDHLHCRLNVPALRACRADYDALADRSGVHFGIEASCVRRYDLEENDKLGDAASSYCVQQGGPPEGELVVYLPEDLLTDLDVEYVVGGAHWVLGAPLEQDAVIRSYHRQNMFLAEHPRIDIVAHPWWWMGAWKEENGKYPGLPWLGDFGVIPRSMHAEFAAAAVEHSTAVEINAHAIFLNPNYPGTFRKQYVEYLAFLKGAGVRFSVGSDSHYPGYSGVLPQIESDLDELGLSEQDLWRPPSVH